MIKKMFFCETCRKKVDQIDQLYFVEDMSDRGFCSEECIKVFYRPYMVEFENEENLFRKELLLDDEDDILSVLADNMVLNQSIRFPDEVWCELSDIGQKFYTHIKRHKFDGNDIYVILICSYVSGAASFVYYRTATTSNALLDKYRRSEKVLIESVTNVETSDQSGAIPSEQLEILDSKKSLFLAELLTQRKDDDIAFEKFIEYDMYMDMTLSSPDEIYRCHDIDDDLFYVNIKTYKNDDHTFFYFVLTLGVDDSLERQIPILGFPSTDKELYLNYCALGVSIKEQIRN